MKRKTMILGLGNLLLRDEGLGVRAIERLRQDYSLPGEVEILDGGTLGISLLPYFVGISDLLIIDAVDIDQSPGTMVRLEGEAIPAALMPKISMHQVGLQELLAAGYISGELPPHIVLLGLQPENIDWGTELTATIQSALNGLVQAIMEELRERDVTPSQLSGGQQQSAAIARALANDPQILVTDEPTGNLDSRTSEHVFELLNQLAADGKTILMVTHDDDLARRAGRVITIKDGEILG